MSEVLNFKILGEPRAKQSFRFAIRESKDRGAFVSKYQPESVEKDTKELIVQILEQLPQGHIPWIGGILVQIRYTFAFTQSMLKNKSKMAEFGDGKIFYKTTKPDLDNLEKMLYDTMQNRVYVNDSQICHRFSEKIYGHIPGVEISLKHIGQQ